MQIRPGLCAILLVATVTVASAVTVHFSFSEAVGEVRVVVGPAVGVPEFETTGVLSAFDIYYDPATATADGFGDFYFDDPSRNFWRVRIDSEALGSMIVTRPLEVLRASDHSLQLSFLTYQPGPKVELLDFDATFVEQIAAGGVLPGPLLPRELTALTPAPEQGPVMGRLLFYTSYFDIPDLVYVYGGGRFGASQVEVIGQMTPVPEPSAYAATSGALLVVLLVCRMASRRRVETGLG